MSRLNELKENPKIPSGERETVKFLEEDLKADGPPRSSKSRVNDFDQVLDLVGSDAWYQKLLIYGFVCPFSVLMPMFVLNTVFLLAEPGHWCHVTGNENGSYTAQEWKELNLPRELGPDGHERFSQCFMYDNGSSAGSNRLKIPCNQGWDYDTSNYLSTIPTANNWVCDKSHYTAQAFTAASIGNAVGALGYGYVGDKYGRKIVFVAAILLNLISRAASFYLTDRFWIFLSMQFLVGTSFPMVYIAVFAIIAEICHKDYRSWIYAVSWICWVLGISLLPLFAWALANWYTFGLLSLVPLILVTVYFKAIPESPRWYLSVGRLEDAEKVLLQIARVNRTVSNIQQREVGRMLTELSVRQEQDQLKNQGIWTLFTKKRVAVRTILLSVVWSMNALVYYGITLNTTSMAGNQFVNFFILSIIELPTGWLGGFLVEKTGRRWTQVVFFTLCMIGFLVAAIGVIAESHLLIIFSLIVSKFSVAITSFVVTLQAIEVFPTQLRSNGSGFASTVGSITAIAAPLIVYLGKIHILIPYLSLALMSGIGIVSSSLLPETFGQSLPETLEDANNLGKNAKFWSWLPTDYKPKRRRSSIFGGIADLTNSVL